MAEGSPPIVIASASMAGASRRRDRRRGALDARERTAGHRAGRRRRGVGLLADLVRIGAVDHRALFPRAGLVVHHGGSGTTHAVCAAGAPSLVIPHVGDQPYWADRLQRLGVAPPPQPVRGLRADRLADAALAAAGDRSMKERAQLLATELADEDGLGVAVAALEGLTG